MEYWALRLLRVILKIKSTPRHPGDMCPSNACFKTSMKITDDTLEHHLKEQQSYNNVINLCVSV